MIEFRLPSLGSDMDQGTLVEWRVRPGEHVSRGQVVAVVDTVKAAIDVECWHDGIVHALLTPPGSTLPVGAVMAVLRSEGESAEEVERLLARGQAIAPAPVTPAVRVAELAPGAATATMTPPPVHPAGTGPIPALPAGQAERLRISPLARRRASELGIDTAQLSGSGAMGSVTLADVEAAQQARALEVGTPAVAAPKASRAAEMRRVIAAAMSRSKREIPHYYLGEDIAFERAAAWLAERNRHLPVTQRLLPAALLLKAVAQALQRYPEFNGFWRDGAFVPGAGVHLGVAVSLREGGLVAPALHDVPSLDVAALTRALLDLVKRTRAGALRSSELARRDDHRHQPRRPGRGQRVRRDLPAAGGAGRLRPA